MSEPLMQSHEFVVVAHRRSSDVLHVIADVCSIRCVRIYRAAPQERTRSIDQTIVLPHEYGDIFG